MIKIKGYKGFDKNLKCSNFQYEIGKTYELEGEKPTAGCTGFHLCEYPLDIFACYPPAQSRYCEVEGGGDYDRDCNDSTVAVSKLRIGPEIGLKGLIEVGLKYILDNARETKGDYSAAVVEADQWTSVNTGDYSAAAIEGKQATAVNTGDRSIAAARGNWSAATNTGDHSAAVVEGNWAAAVNTGDRSAAAAEGIRSAASNTGYRSEAAVEGDRSLAANIGDWSAASAKGDWAVAVNTGDDSITSVEGKGSIALAAGHKSAAKGALGCWIVLTEWAQDENGDYQIVDVQCAKVDGERIKPDTFYRLECGEFVEATEML